MGIRAYENVDWKIVGTKGSLGRYKNIIEINNIYQLSSRTVTKIVNRLLKNKEISCCVCGWDLARGHIHHIKGRKIENANSHDNLTYLCPNCHTLAHENLLDMSKVINLNVHIGDLWKKYYFG